MQRDIEVESKKNESIKERKYDVGETHIAMKETRRYKGRERNFSKT